MNWQPIETAPRDGTKILAIEDDNSFNVVWFCEDCFVREGDMDSFFVKPTHWMPLPSPPGTVSPDDRLREVAGIIEEIIMAVDAGFSCSPDHLDDIKPLANKALAALRAWEGRKNA